MKVDTLKGVVLMTPIVYPIGNVLVEKPDAHRIRLKCYYRNISIFNKNVVLFGNTEPTDVFCEDGITYMYIPTKQSSLFTPTTFYVQKLRMLAGNEDGATKNYGPECTFYDVRYKCLSTMEDFKSLDHFYRIEKREGNMGDEVYRLKKGKPIEKVAIIIDDSIAGVTHVDGIYSLTGSEVGFTILATDSFGKKEKWRMPPKKWKYHEIYRWNGKQSATLTDLLAFRIFCDGEISNGTESADCAFIRECIP